MTGYESKKAMAQDKLESMEREALKLALDAILNFPDDISDEMFKAIASIKEALAQPAQEQVALVIDGVLVEYAVPEKYTGHLYTIPPQRTWVGLTAQEAAECWTTSATQTWKNFEAKLKDKNNG